ncbi:MAG TPA: hypothetical protein VNQ99_06245 [Xanthobacteraceae bacterium]|nr:hypothetical protein [Xanthobacteraceae bacterium]
MFDALGIADPEYTPGEQIALMRLRRTDMANEVMLRLQAQGHRATGKDYWRLRTRRLADKNVDRDFLFLTPVGKHRADALARTLAKQFGLHHFIRSESRYHANLTCTCGWSTSLSLNQGHMASQVSRAAARHFMAVRDREASAQAETSMPMEAVHG